MTVAMRTWTSVSIESCQSPIAKMRTRHAPATTAARSAARDQGEAGGDADDQPERRRS